MGWFSSSPEPSRQAVTPGPVDPGATRISPGTRITGTLGGATEVVIDGEVEGQVQLDGAVLVGGSGQVRGVIHARAVRVAGKVVGDVHGLERVELLAGGSVEGDLLAPRVVVHEGAFLSGKVAMHETTASAEGVARPGKAGRPPGGQGRAPEPRERPRNAGRENVEKGRAETPAKAASAGKEMDSVPASAGGGPEQAAEPVAKGGGAGETAAPAPSASGKSD